jgi:inner membrane protein involved in colicin E2 resistance
MNKNLILLMLSLILISSCISEREKKINQINAQSKSLLDSALLINPTRNIPVGIETFDTIGIMAKYLKIRKDSAKLGLDFVLNVLDKIKILNQKKDSVYSAYYSKTRKLGAYDVNDILNPDWSEDDCIKIQNHEIWIGMSLDMVICERHCRPADKHSSDYGNGRRWQWIFDVGSPSYFYGGDDEIITAYN